MTKNEIPQIDLDIELFVHKNDVLASFVVLNALASNDQEHQSAILETISDKHLPSEFTQFLFVNMKEMITKFGMVAIENLRQRISAFAPNAPQFTKGCHANFAQIIVQPTDRQVRESINILISQSSSLAFSEENGCDPD